jgi:hypothetical protein
MQVRFDIITYASNFIQQRLIGIYALKPHAHYILIVGRHFLLNNEPLIKDKISNEDKNTELAKYRDLVTATLDYLIDNNAYRIKTPDFDSDSHYKILRGQTAEHFQKGRLSKLKQWFHDLTETQRETGDLKFNTYLKIKTGQDINIFQDCYDRVDKIVAKGKIATDNQFYDVSSMVDHLSQLIPIDNAKLNRLNNLLTDYEQRRTKKSTN